jgi:putative membrane protein
MLFTYPIFTIATIAMSYELIEWIYAATSDPVAGAAYLGSQGDIWDAQKDMLMAIIGAVLAMIIVFILNSIFNKDHIKEVKESLKIKKGDKPLGEERLAEYFKKNK